MRDILSPSVTRTKSGHRTGRRRRRASLLLGFLRLCAKMSVWDALGLACWALLMLDERTTKKQEKKESSPSSLVFDRACKRNWIENIISFQPPFRLPPSHQCRRAKGKKKKKEERAQRPRHFD